MALKRLWPRLTQLDRWIVLLLLILCLFGFWWSSSSDQGSWLVAERNGEIFYRVQLSSDQKVSLSGPLGETELLISDGRARVISSPCRAKICIGMGAISHPGEIIACVPNRILLTIPGTRSENEVGYDVLSR
jgi:hypothetical protein